MEKMRMESLSTQLFYGLLPILAIVFAALLLLGAGGD
jgi:flagellar biogenesis protein FliO